MAVHNSLEVVLRRPVLDFKHDIALRPVRVGVAPILAGLEPEHTNTAHGTRRSKHVWGTLGLIYDTMHIHGSMTLP